MSYALKRHLYYNTAMDEILNIYKPIGLTPFQLIEDLRKQDLRLKNIKIGYAGRLDPLAHGVMLLTVGEANKRREEFLNLNKMYQIKVLFGVETDSYDTLGLITASSMKPLPNDLKAKIEQFISENIGKFDQPYPPFSSKPVNGIPMYKLAKKGTLDQFNIPTKTVEIYSIKLLNITQIPASKLKKTIVGNLKLVKGHFRQTKTIKLWQHFFKSAKDTKLTEAELEIKCSSGTYMRSLAHKLGQKLGSYAIASEILRTKVGNYKIKDSINLVM